MMASSQYLDEAGDQQSVERGASFLQRVMVAYKLQGFSF
jgi:hypothetical protein